MDGGGVGAVGEEPQPAKQPANRRQRTRRYFVALMVFPWKSAPDSASHARGRWFESTSAHHLIFPPFSWVSCRECHVSSCPQIVNYGPFLYWCVSFSWHAPWHFSGQWHPERLARCR